MWYIKGIYMNEFLNDYFIYKCREFSIEETKEFVFYLFDKTAKDKKRSTSEILEHYSNFKKNNP